MGACVLWFVGLEFVVLQLVDMGFLGCTAVGILLTFFFFCAVDAGRRLKCDVIKQNQSEVGNIDFKIEPHKAENVLCFLLCLASFNCLYLWNKLPNFNRVFCKM